MYMIEWIGACASQEYVKNQKFKTPVEEEESFKNTKLPQ